MTTSRTPSSRAAGGQTRSSGTSSNGEVRWKTSPGRKSASADEISRPAGMTAESAGGIGEIGVRDVAGDLRGVRAALDRTRELEHVAADAAMAAVAALCSLDVEVDGHGRLLTGGTAPPGIPSG